MLTLTRRTGEGIAIGTDVEIVVLGVSRGRVRIGIRAPRSTPVHRSEVVERIEKSNREAVAAVIPEQVVADSAITFEAGLFGLGQHKRFVLCEVGDTECFSALVSCQDPNLQLLVVDAEGVWPDYPIDEAKVAAGFADRDVAVAAVATVPADGSAATVNLKAPLIIDLESRQGVQVILDREELGVAHGIVARRDQISQAPEAR